MNDLFIDDSDLIQRDNTSTRIPVVLCLDTSKSMSDDGNAGFDGLNKGVKSFYDTCKNDSVNKYGFDVAIVTFGAQGVNVNQDFRPIWNADYPDEFSFSSENWVDGTPLGEGAKKSLEILLSRKEEYKNASIGYYQPWLVFISDGHPTTSNYLQETVDQCRKLQKSKQLKVIAIGVGSDDYKIMAQYVIDGKVLVTKDFSCFDKVFEFLSKSMSSSSTKNALEEQIQDSPLKQIQEDLEDEGIISCPIEDFPIEEDLAKLL